MSTATRVLEGVFPRDHAEIAQNPDKARSQLDIYLAGQRTLDARNRITLKHNRWLMFAVGALLVICGIEAVENMRTASKSHLVPYIIQTDQQGRVLNTEILRDRSMEEHFSPTKTITAELSGWVEDWRTVSTDMYAQQSLANRVFSMVAEHSEGSTWLLNWYKTHDPLDLGKKAHVEATVKSVLPQSLNSYEVFWEERETNLSSQTPAVSRWRSVITLSINPPKNEAEVHRNRFGLYVERLTEPQRENQ